MPDNRPSNDEFAESKKPAAEAESVLDTADNTLSTNVITNVAAELTNSATENLQDKLAAEVIGSIDDLGEDEGVSNEAAYARGDGANGSILEQRSNNGVRLHVARTGSTGKAFNSGVDVSIKPKQIRVENRLGNTAADFVLDADTAFNVDADGVNVLHSELEDRDLELKHHTITSYGNESSHFPVLWNELLQSLNEHSYDFWIKILYIHTSIKAIRDQEGVHEANLMYIVNLKKKFP